MMPTATIVDRGRITTRLRHCAIHGHDYERSKTFVGGFVVMTQTCAHCDRTIKTRVPAPGTIEGRR